MRGSRNGLWLAAILLVALALRLAFWFTVVGFDTTGWGDEPDYHRMASSVAAGDGLVNLIGEPTASRPPLYPVVLGGVYAILGDDPDVARAFQVLLGVAAVWLVHRLARRLTTQRAALIAAALAAANPALVYMSGLIMSENLYIMTLLAIALVLVRSSHPAGGSEALKEAAARPQGALSVFAMTPRGALVIGALTGVAYLIRPQMLFFAAFIGLAYLCARRLPWRARLARMALMAIAAAVVISPWVVRNYRHFDALVPSTTHGGITFYESNNELIPANPDFRGIVVIPRKAVPGWDELKDLPEVEYNSAAWAKGIAFVKSHPALSVRMAWWKLLRFWRFDAGITAPERVTRALPSALEGLVRHVDLGAVYWWAVMPFSVIGLAASWKARRRVWVLYAMIVSHTVVALIFHGSIRARSPVEPAIVILAAIGVSWIRSAIVGARPSAPERAAA